MLCTVVLIVAALTACICLFIVGLDVPGELGFYGSLSRGLKMMDDHGEVVFAASQAAALAGDRAAVAVTTSKQIDVLRYVLMPRPVYVLPDPATPTLSLDYVRAHRRLLEEKGVRWLLWVQWREQRPWMQARLYDATMALRGAPGPGVRVWAYVGRERPTRLADYLVATLVLVLVVLLGWAARPLLFREEPAESWLEALPRGFALGLVGLYGVFASLMLLGARLSRGLVVGVGLALVVGAVLARLALVRKAAGGPFNLPQVKKPAGGCLWLRAGAVTVCVVAFLCVLGLALVMPVRNVDALHHWGFTAKTFYYEGGMYGPLYFDKHRDLGFRRYPILVPLTLATLYEAMGRVEDQAAKVLFPTAYAMMLLGLYGAMRRERPGPGALLMMATLAACGAYFIYEGGAASALADVPLSLFILLGLVEWGRWARSGGRSHLLWWVALLCGAAVTKTEGLVLLGFALLAAAVLRRRTRPVPWPRVAGVLACVAVLVGPWYGFAATVRGGGSYLPRSGKEAATIASNLSGLPAATEKFLAGMIDLGQWKTEMLGEESAAGGAGPRWGAFWLLVVVAVAVGWRGASPAHQMVLGLVLCQLGAYFGSYVLAPVDPVTLVGTTETRLLLHLAPAAAYLAWCFFPPLPRWLEAPRQST